MKRNKSQLTQIAMFIVLTFALSPAWAQDIVIDSGTDETVISRIPNADLQETFVCADSTDGTLGQCQNAILGFYSASEEFQTTEPSTDYDVNVFCDDGDKSINASYVIGSLSDIEVRSIFPSTANPENCHSAYRTGAGDSFFFRLQCLCMDFPPAH